MNQEYILTDVTTQKSDQSQVIKTAKDVFLGLASWRIWLIIAWQDIRVRYRRSHLGPFWLTISMAVQIYTIGFLYSKLFHIDLSEYYPYLAGGLLSWSLLSTLINDSTLGFVNAENYLRQMKMPYTIFIMRVISRNLIIFFHNVVVIVPIFFIFNLPINNHILALIPGIFIIILNGFGFGLLFSMLGARYRDINQLIQNLVQVSFFLTPIMWLPNRIPPQYHYIIDYNPFAQFVTIIRDPLIGQLPSFHSYLFTAGLGVLSIMLALCLFNSVRRYIIYWL